MTIYLDFETFSEVDLKKCGAAAYASHPSTRVLLSGWTRDEEAVRVDEEPEDLKEALQEDEAELIVAFNAPFEMLQVEHKLNIDIPLERFRCAMAQSYALGFAGSLGMILKQRGLPEELWKNPEGALLVRRFCQPQGKSFKHRIWNKDNYPDKWDSFVAYCQQDVVTLRALWQLNSEFIDENHPIWEGWFRDQRINRTGIPVDTDLINHAMRTYTKAKVWQKAALVDLTGLDNPNSPVAMREWLAGNGVDLLDMRAATVDNWCAEHPQSEYAAILEGYRNLSRTAPTKWRAFKDRAVSGRVQGAFIYLGASRTGRWASRGINLQNLKRPGRTHRPRVYALALQSENLDLINATFGDPIQMLSESVRAAVTAPPGSKLVSSDLSNIESRLLGQVTMCRTLNAVFEKGRDPYKDLATDVFSKPYDEITPEERNFSKPPALGCGYGLGPKGLQKHAEQYRVAMDDEQAQHCVDTFRWKYPEVKSFWYQAIDACKTVTLYGAGIDVNGIRFQREGEFLTVLLPSGRRLFYHFPEVKDQIAPWGEVVKAFTCRGWNQFMHRWERISTHGGGITENIVQAIARDVLEGAMTAFACRYPGAIVGHIHDEVLAEVFEDDAEEALKYLDQCLCTPPSWMPRVILGSEGKITMRYWK